MAATNRRDDPEGNGRIDFVAYPRTVPYRSIPDTRLPGMSQTKIRRGGLFGLGSNPQDREHARHITELYHLAVEAAFAEEMATGMEVAGIKVASDWMEKAEGVVYSHSADSVAGMLATDMTGDAAARMRVRHGRLTDVYDAEAMNILHKRRHY